MDWSILDFLFNLVKKEDTLKMTHTITIKIWDKKDQLITNKRVQIVDEYVTDSKISIPFDERVFQLLQEDTTYEITIDLAPVTIYKTYKSGKWLVIVYNGGK